MPTLAYLLLLLSLVANTRPAPAQKPVPIKAVTACLAVTRADLEQALGRSFSAGKEETSGAESSCDYAADGGQVTIMIHRLTEALDMPAELESLKSAIPGASLREVAGIGTRAFFLDIGDAGGERRPDGGVRRVDGEDRSGVGRRRQSVRGERCCEQRREPGRGR